MAVHQGSSGRFVHQTTLVLNLSALSVHTCHALAASAAAYAMKGQLCPVCLGLLLLLLLHFWGRPRRLPGRWPPTGPARLPAVRTFLTPNDQGPAQSPADQPQAWWLSHDDRCVLHTGQVCGSQVKYIRQMYTVCCKAMVCPKWQEDEFVRHV